MTPQERALVADLFDRLARLETAPRDPEAERLMIDGLRRAPNAVYALVQTTLLQDEALRRADERIRELETQAEPAPSHGGGFLDSMRESLFGQRSDPPRRGAVPSVGGGNGAMGVPPGFRQAAGGRDEPQQQARPSFGGGSFLGTAAASAAGVIGGALLLDSVRSMFGGGPAGQAAAATGESGAGGRDTASLGEQAGVNDVDQHGAENHGLFDTAQYDDADYFDDSSDFDAGGDFGDFA